MRTIVIILVGFMIQTAGFSNAEKLISTDTLPYYQILDAPETYTAANVTARMIDGLGYRYHWATEGLRTEDLAYDPGNDGKICSEVLEHLLGLSRFILRTVKGEDHGKREYPELDWEGQRSETLNNLLKASKILRETGDVSEMNIIFKRGEQTNEIPFWHVINGPIADGIYHAGQIVSYRRSSGNPSNPNVSVLMGKNKEPK